MIKHLAYGLVAATLLTLVGLGAYGWHEGYRAYAVRTGSMNPTYPTGALVVDAPARTRQVQVGQVVTFRTANGLVTHRVVGTKGAGYETKGDANRTADPWTLAPHNVTGTVVWGAASLGYVLVFLQQPTGVLALVLLLTSVWLAWSIFFPSEPEQGAAVGRRVDAARGDAARGDAAQGAPGVGPAVPVTAGAVIVLPATDGVTVGPGPDRRGLQPV